MNWKNLKNNKCPKCLGVLTHDKDNMILYCDDCGDFKIGEERFEEIVNGLYKPKKRQQEDEDERRMAELNNFGEEDFSEDLIED